jgi:hypothetical protein
MSGHEIGGIERMSIAGASDEDLAALRDFFTRVADHGTEDGKRRAPLYLAAIDEELALRGREPK